MLFQLVIQGILLKLTRIVVLHELEDDHLLANSLEFIVKSLKEFIEFLSNAR